MSPTCLFCLILLCVSVLSSVLWWPLRCPHKTIFDSSLPPVVYRRVHVLFTLFVLFAHSGVQYILCCVFVLFFFVLCTLCWVFLWIIIFNCPVSITRLKLLNHQLFNVHLLLSSTSQNVTKQYIQRQSFICKLHIKWLQSRFWLSSFEFYL